MKIPYLTNISCPRPSLKRTQPIPSSSPTQASGALAGPAATHFYAKNMLQIPNWVFYLCLYLLIITLLLVTQTAFASDGDDWGLKPMIEKILGFIDGTGGKLLGLIGLVIAIYFAAFQLDLKPAAIWFGIAVIILGAPNIINTVFSAVI